MEFEWDPKKSALNKVKHGISFEEVEVALAAGVTLGTRVNAHHPGQEVIVFRGLDGKIYMAAIEPRGSKIRIVTAHRSRKMERDYGP